MKRLFVIACLCLFSSQALTGQRSTFSSIELLEDISYLKNSLEASHYDLYAYVSREVFSDNYDEVVASIPHDSLTRLQAITLLQRVISVANTGHAEIDFPAADYIAYGKQGGTVLPFEVALENNKAFIRRNYASNTSIKVGDEVLQINGSDIKDILSAIYPQLSAERIYLKNAKLEFWTLPRLYWQLYGEHKAFKVLVRSGQEVRQHNLPAVSLIEGFEIPRKDVLASNRRFEFFEASAYLNPGSFSGNEKSFRSFIDSAFIAINHSAAKNLIIDLRNNVGGHNDFSDYLIAFLTDRPFPWCADFTLKSSPMLKAKTKRAVDTTDAYSREILSRRNQEVYPYQFPLYQPHTPDKRFSGRVYALSNRQTYSMAAVAAAQLQDLKLATIVGEETGDYPTLYASQFSYALPNTGVTVKVPKGYIIRAGGGDQAKGVVPEILIPDHLLDEVDEVLMGLQAMLKEEE